MIGDVIGDTGTQTWLGVNQAANPVARCLDTAECIANGIRFIDGDLITAADYLPMLRYDNPTVCGRLFYYGPWDTMIMGDTSCNTGSYRYLCEMTCTNPTADLPPPTTTPSPPPPPPPLPGCPVAIPNTNQRTLATVGNKVSENTQITYVFRLKLRNLWA